MNDHTPARSLAMRLNARDLGFAAALLTTLVACGPSDPCAALPSSFEFTSVQACGHDRLTVSELQQIDRGELSVPALPYKGPWTNASDLPTESYGSDTTRAVCTACVSVCDCWLSVRECVGMKAANKAMPKRIKYTTSPSPDSQCAGTPVLSPNGALACRGGQCVWEEGSTPPSN